MEKVYSLLADPSKTAQEWEQEFLDSPYAARALVASLPPPVSEGTTTPSRRQNVGYLQTLRILLARQWKVLLADPLNLIFLFAQALAIGGMVGWVAENAGLRMFLCVVATLWFGCSNGAQQIVGELPIFRRERVCGLGLNVYLQSKLGFLSMLTVVQAVLLFSTIFLTAHLFQKNDFDRTLFASRLEERYSSMSPASQAAADNAGDFEVVSSNASDSSSTKPPSSSPPAEPAEPPKPSAAVTNVTSALASFFYLSDNILDSGGRAEKFEDGTRSRSATASTHDPGLEPAQRLHHDPGPQGHGGACRRAGRSGARSHDLGLVRSSTQAVMWVPLILIPQILFGGFVITVPDMSMAVYRFSHLVRVFGPADHGCFQHLRSGDALSDQPHEGPRSS